MGNRKAPSPPPPVGINKPPAPPPPPRVASGIVSVLTSDERRIVSVAKVGSDHGTDLLVAIIERLTGEEIRPADQPPYRRPKSQR